MKRYNIYFPSISSFKIKIRKKLKVILISDMIGSTASLFCYSSFLQQQYEKCDKGDYCFFLEDYPMLNPTDTQNHTRSCERRGYCKVIN